jgi:4-amino-4-deoxy-L-arabinose transferase-like glycosyltransferase
LPPPTNKNASLGWLTWLIILGISVLVCCYKLGDARTLTEHEVSVAGGAKQMAVDHDWLFPKIGDHLWLEKPPLLHWLVIGSARLFGKFSEATVRFPSVMAGVGIVVIMTKLALRWFGSGVAVLTGLVQTTTVYFITYARLAEAEMLLAFFIVLGLFLFVRLHSIGSPRLEQDRHSALLFWTVVGLSNMAKGLGFGPMVILVACFAYLLLERDSAAWRRTISWAGIMLGLAVAVAWPLTIVALRAPDAQMIWRANIEQRLVGGPYDQPWWYYLTTAPWQLLPWTPALLLVAGPSLARAWHQNNSGERFLWCWALVPIAILTLFRGKHHHYIIAPLCALSPFCAVGLLRAGTRFASACIALAVGAIMFVDARIMPTRDRCRADCDFLKRVREMVPSDIPLAAAGGPEIARPIFYIEPPPLGVGNSTDLKMYFPATAFYVITRQREEPYLATLGRVDLVSQSRYTRGERDPSDRFTLFKVQPLGSP